MRYGKLLFAAMTIALCAGFGVGQPALAESPVRTFHGLSIHGKIDPLSTHEIPDLKYPENFQHFDYVNPDAPKGGTLRQAAFGTFDNLNPFIVKGNAGALVGIYETLLTSSADEAASAYGLIASSVELAHDRSSVAFNIRPEARWHDGQPITADDVVFSFDVLTTKGIPLYANYYAGVDRVVKVNDHKVQFIFKPGNNRELPYILGELPVLPKHYWQTRRFEDTTLEPPLGSGPYKVASVDAGRALVFERVKDYWGQDLPVNRGTNNWDVVRIDYYRDQQVMREAFKAGAYDFWQENTAKEWATSYDIPAVRNGWIVKREIPNENPAGMQAFVFNTRRPIFQDVRVREALNYAFDFEWSNKNLFYGQYKRSQSFFANSELASGGLPQGEELQILEKYRGRIPERAFSEAYAPPQTDGSGNIRDNLRRAQDLMRQAGWTVQNGQMTNAQGQKFQFEILLVNPTFERIVLPFTQNLKRIGITASVRTVDDTQYLERVNNFDYDMIVGGWGQTLSPGNEQRDFWSSAAAEQKGSLNTAGIKDPVIDEMVEALIASPTRDSLVAHTKALDRVLLWNFFVIPHWNSGVYRIAYWDKFGMPQQRPKYGLGFDAWWIDPAKEAALKGKQVKP